jgi:methylmalonyl-CoA/ethylmalonyl-CoA epimerase
LVKDLEKAASEYVTRFGYEIKSSVIHDPIQTAYVQFLMLKENGPYIELITPDCLESKLSNALRKGGGLNHLCYQTDNIEGTFNRLADGGMFALQQPVPAVAFSNCRISWLMGRNANPVELVEKGVDIWEMP